MKRLFSSLLILILITASLPAFSQGAPKPNWGAKGGVNFANVPGDSDANKIKVAWHLGVYGEVFFDYQMMLMLELLLSAQGHGGDVSKLNSLYLNLPILFRYNLGTYNFNIHAGLQPGFLLSAKAESGGSTFDVKDFQESFDLGLPIGVGYQFEDRKISLVLRYIYGLTKFSGNNRNSVLQLSAAFKLGTVN